LTSPPAHRIAPIEGELASCEPSFAVSPANAIRLAVIDDDSGFLTVLRKRLEEAEWQHRELASGVAPDELVAMKLNALLVDPAVLDDGWGYLERLCETLPELGVIVCTAQSTVAQRVRGLRLGVDDWIAKPCHPSEAIARIEAVTRRHRRARPTAAGDALVAGELEIHPDRFQTFVAGECMALTRREFELLQLLAEAPGAVLERETIYQRVWGYAMAHGDRSVDVFIRKLRHKLEKRSPAWRYIHTHFGVGYRFDPEPIGGSDRTGPVEAGSESWSKRSGERVSTP
jgi:DNA-binding response OmpR family regulator